MINRQVLIKQRTSNSSAKLNSVSPLIQRLYQSRGIQNDEECLTSMHYLLPPTSLMNADKAAMLLSDAIVEKKRMLIVGDFDADGATATAVAIRGLKLLGATCVEYLVPNRFKYGYGLTPEIVTDAVEFQPDILITVDNGISSFEGVAAARQHGWEVLITDHHLPGDEVPSANVIVNPNQFGDKFPSKSLSGVGVMFYVLAATRQLLEQRGWFSQNKINMPNLAQLLDLVALGTVADVVPLDWNNRILVDQGLRRIRAGKCAPGITALIQVSGRNQATLQAGDLGFAVAPRLNAAGRIEDMSIGIECLLTDDLSSASQLAQRLDSINVERRTIEQGMKESALEHVGALLEGLDQASLPYSLCLYDESWHQGVIGILASRIKALVHRPVIAFAPDDETHLKGSARSIPGLHIRDALDLVASRNPGLLSKFGGHAMAAGLSLEAHNLEDFKTAFNKVVCELIDEDDLAPVLWSDGELEGAEISLEIAKELQQAGPWGQAFPEPLFEGEFVVIDRRVVGDKHLKLNLRSGPDTQPISAIQFFYDEQDWPESCNHFYLAYKLTVNEYRGQESVQLNIEHARAIS